MSNKMIVEAFYREQLGRSPDNNEVSHWAHVIDSEGVSVFADQILASEESKALQIRRRDREKRQSYQFRLAELQKIDSYFVDLCLEIHDSSAVIWFSESARNHFPIWQLKRFASSPLLDISSDLSDQPAVRIRARFEQTVGQADPALDIVLMDVNRHHTEASEGAEGLRGIRLHPAKTVDRSLHIGSGQNLHDLRGPVFPDFAPEIDGLLEIKDIYSNFCWIRNIKRSFDMLVVSHFLLGNTAIVRHMLEQWDALMGANLSQRFRSFSGGLR